MAIPLGRPLPSASCDRPERRREGPPGIPAKGMPAAPTWSCSRWGFPCRRRCRRRGALLPHRFTLAGRPVFRGGPAVYFLWHFPWGRPRRALPGTVPPWSPDFPLSPEGESGHPAVWHSELGSSRRACQSQKGPAHKRGMGLHGLCNLSRARPDRDCAAGLRFYNRRKPFQRPGEKGKRHVGNTRYGGLSLRGQRQLG